MTVECAAMTKATAWDYRSRCSRKGVVERDGKWYCLQHDPVAVAARRAKRDEISQAERRARAELARQDSLRRILCQNVSEDDLRRAIVYVQERGGLMEALFEVKS